MIDVNHLKKVKMGYLFHFCFALKIAFVLVMAAILCVFHAIFPFIFPDSASTAVTKISHMVSDHHNRIKAKDKHEHHRDENG